MLPCPAFWGLPLVCMLLGQALYRLGHCLVIKMQFIIVYLLQDFNQAHMELVGKGKGPHSNKHGWVFSVPAQRSSYHYGGACLTGVYLSPCGVCLLSSVSFLCVLVIVLKSWLGL